MKQVHKQGRPADKKLGRQGVDPHLKEAEAGKNYEERGNGAPPGRHEIGQDKPNAYEEKASQKTGLNPESGDTQPPEGAKKHITHGQHGYHYPLLFIGGAEFGLDQGIRNPLDVLDKAEKKHSAVDNKKEENTPEFVVHINLRLSQNFSFGKATLNLDEKAG
jgi:hypothetical protein